MALGELVAHFVGEVVIELAIRGPGYVLARVFKPSVDPDGAMTLVTGLAFWLVVGAFGYLAYRGAVS